MEENANQNIGPEKRYKKYLAFAWELFKIALIAVVIVAPIRYFLFQPFIVKGESMSPNFESGDYLIVDEISYRFSEPKRGDVVVFNFPKDPTQRFIKRIIGLPGETVNVAAGEVEIIKSGNTAVLDEKYLRGSLKTIGEIKITLKSGEYLVLGDNRDYSYDSRAWGVLPGKNIIGKALLRLFPFAEIGLLAKPAY